MSPTTSTPTKALERNYSDVEMLLKKLTKQVRHFNKVAHKDGAHFGHVGSMGHVAAELRELCRFIGD